MFTLCFKKGYTYKFIYAGKIEKSGIAGIAGSYGFDE